VARILLCEPHTDIRTMLSFVVRRLGHEPLVCDGSREQLFRVDALVIEPGWAQALEIAGWAREHSPHIAIVCTSIFPPWHGSEALQPDAYLVKPFALYQLENALAAALERRANDREHALQQV
jgi:DNA-binding response OmpR family regulator